MAGGLSLKVLLQLQKQQFDQGIKSVKKSLESLGATIKRVSAIVVGGLGLVSLARNLKETAVQLSVAQASLENVSKSLGETEENFEFLKRISNEYGQDLLVLTQSFAKFRAAAGYAGVSLDQIKKIYEALTRAAGAYHLSAEQTGLVMIAVEQMFSKGKVTAEELRRQLGNSLPGAFGIMAEAAGRAGVTMHGTTGELEKAMKAGKVLAKDVLPEFANVLNEVTEGANFDSLQSSINRFANAWTMFTESTGFDSMLQGLVDFGTKVLNFFKDNLNTIKQLIISVFAGFAGGKILGRLKASGDAAFNSLKAKMAETVVKERELSAELGKFQTQLNSLNSGKIKGITTAISSAEAAAAGLDKSIISALSNLERDGQKVHKITISNADAQRLLEYRIKDTENQIKQTNAQYQALSTQAIASTSRWGKTVLAVKNAFVTLGNTIKAVVSSTIIGAIISVVTYLIQKVYELVSSFGDVEDEIREIKSEIDTPTGAIYAQIKQVENLQQKLEDINLTEKDRKKLLDQLNNALGLQKKEFLTIRSTSEDINAKIQKWKDNLLNAARAAGAFNALQKLSEKSIEAQRNINEIRRDPHYGETKQVTVENGYGGYEFTTAWTRKALVLRTRESMWATEKDQYEKAIQEILQMIDENGWVKPEDTDTGNNDNDFLPDPDKVETTFDKIKKVFDKYNEEAKKLKNQLDNGALSTSQYEKELSELGDKTWESLAGFDELYENLRKLDGGADDSFTSLAHSFKKNFEFNKVKKYAEKVAGLFNKKMKEVKENAEKYSNKIKEVMEGGIPSGKTRDTFFDYKKTGSDIYDEESSNQSKLVEELEQFKQKLEDIKEEFGYLDPEAQAVFDSIIEKLKEAKEEATNLKDKANVAQWMEDVKKLKKELNDINYTSFKNLADSFDRLVRGSKNLADAWATLTDNKLDTETEKFFEKLDAGLSILNEGIQLFETVKTVIDGLKKSEEAYGALKQALNSQEAIDSSVKIGILQAEEAASLKNAGTVVGAEQMKQAAIEKTTGKQAVEAVVGAGASVAGTPFIGPILAGAAIAAMIALMAKAMGAFANGGIVGGNSKSGDKVLARVNSGEMILNRSQQSTLFNAIKSGNLGGGGKVEFEIRGDRLKGVLNNYESKRRG